MADLLDLIRDISQDMDPTQPGYQAHASYVVLAVALPLVVGVAVGVALRTIERVFGAGPHGGDR